MHYARERNQSENTFEILGIARVVDSEREFLPVINFCRFAAEAWSCHKHIWRPEIFDAVLSSPMCSCDIGIGIASSAAFIHINE